MSDVTQGGAGFDRDRVYPVLPLRDIVVFPGMIVPLFVGREKSVKALEEVMRDDKHILVVTQKNAQDDDPSPDEIYATGTIASVLQLLKLPDGTVKVLVEGLRRAKIDQYLQTVDYFEAEATTLPEPEEDETELEALARSAQSEFENYVKLNKKISAEVVNAVSQITNHSKLADTIASHLVIKIEQKEELLGTVSVSERLQKILGLMEGEIGVLQVEKRIRSRVKRQMEKTQREYYLNEQMKAIQRELGDGEEGSNELTELEEKIKKTKLSKEARIKADGELKKLKTMSPMSAEATVVRNYLDWLLTLPWGKKSKVKRDLVYAEQVLDEDHYGLEKVKERILEYLAVQSRTGKLKGPILCLVGPPGVGKTSLGESVARSLGRTFVRVALGGVRDEAEIRGHRRTYVGALPGRIVRAIKEAGSMNPVVLLDEVDKVGSDYRGDPAAALLEVLDPAQNHTFRDHYLELDLDLSDVLFIATANDVGAIPAALLDRMELVSIDGYTEEDKVAIARRHLIPETLKENGLQPKEFVIDDDQLMAVVRNYTREAGVRNLKRELSKLMRKAVRDILVKKSTKVVITPELLEEYLGPAFFRNDKIDAEPQVGAVTGLAWTSVGGEILTIEGVMTHGKGRMTVTGNLKEVMKESITAASGYVRSRAVELGIKPPLFDTRDIHLHVPEGATPKDGPSAGIGMATAIVSLMTGIPVRHDIAMTGEVTLRGRVLPIGGLKEKLLAALRSGIKTVLIPEENTRDLKEIPKNVTEGMEIIPVSRMDEVLSRALIRQPEPIEWKYDDDKPAAVPVVESTVDGDESGASLPH
jgi:ATP-dependent Lon protease